MSIANKIIMSSLLGLMTSASYAMETVKGDLKKSLSLVSEESNTSGYYLSLPIPSFDDVCQFAAHSFDSVKNTVMNSMSDEAAFQKLGWPRSDLNAQQELQKSKNIYRQAYAFCKNNEYHSDYSETFAAIARRYGYLQRVLIAFDNNTIVNDTDRIGLALHCLHYHSDIMNGFDKARFKNIIPHEILNKMIGKKLGWPISDKDAQKALEKSKQIYERINNFLKTFEAYQNYFDDCISVKNLSQYCQDVLFALRNKTISHCSDRAALARHCLEHHGDIMSVLDKATFVLFANQAQQQIKKDTQEIDIGLASLTLISNDNKILDPLVEQTIKQREAQKKEKESDKQKQAKK